MADASTVFCIVRGLTEKVNLQLLNPQWMRQEDAPALIPPSLSQNSAMRAREQTPAYEYFTGGSIRLTFEQFVQLGKTSVVFGSGAHADVRLDYDNSAGVSTHHFRLGYRKLSRPHELELTNLSRNGTIVLGKNLPVFQSVQLQSTYCEVSVEVHAGPISIVLDIPKFDGKMMDTIWPSFQEKIQTSIPSLDLLNVRPEYDITPANTDAAPIMAWDSLDTIVDFDPTLGFDAMLAVAPNTTQPTAAHGQSYSNLMAPDDCPEATRGLTVTSISQPNMLSAYADVSYTGRSNSYGASSLLQAQQPHENVDPASTWQNDEYTDPVVLYTEEPHDAQSQALAWPPLRAAFDPPVSDNNASDVGQLHTQENGKNRICRKPPNVLKNSSSPWITVWLIFFSKLLAVRAFVQA